MSWVMWVMGQLCDGSHGSWVTKDGPFPSLLRKPCKLFASVARVCQRQLSSLVDNPPGVTGLLTDRRVISDNGNAIGVPLLR